jgi:C4-dicarboxylate transporter DctM subunit
MDPVIIGLIGFVAITILIFILGLPVGISMILAGFVGLWLLISGPAAFAKMAIVPFCTASSYDYSVLVLFLFMAEIVAVSGISKNLFNLAAKWLGFLPGGLAMATIIACAIFSAISSSAIATVLTIGLVALPEMKKRGYKDTLAIGTLCLGGPLGVLIPPSAILIIYGIITQNSIGKLFIAGIIPGILTALVYIVTVVIMCLRNPQLGPKGINFSLKEKIKAFSSCWDILALVILVLGGLLIGWFTPTESGAIGAFGAIIIALVRRRLNWQNFKEALIQTMKHAGMIYFIIIGANIFQYFIAVSTIPFGLANFISGLNIAPIGIIAVILLMYLVLGTFMDEMTMMLLTVPIFLPLVLELGFDPIWFGILVTRMVMIGGYSPPYGLLLFTVAGMVPKVPITTVFKSVIPFMVGDLLSVVLLLFVPQIVLFLPNIM